MASLGMEGPYTLSRDGIKKAISKTTAGNYALGYMKDDDTFIVQYVGRSDSDVAGRLEKWADEGNHKSFKYSHATSPKAAFEKECRNYHDFGGSAKLQNKAHPDRPEASGWKCPGCSVFN